MNRPKKSKPAQVLDEINHVNDSIDVSVVIPHDADSKAQAKASAAATAQKLTRPEVSAAAVITSWQKNTHDVNAVVETLSQQVEAVNGGDLSRVEGILIAQAHALDNIFTVLARRATTQEYLKQWEVYMRMAMKAQNQCRMTLESLAAVKNPPVVFAKQANINNGGQQQVNNGTSTTGSGQADVSGAANSQATQTGLLEASSGQGLDIGTTGATGRGDSQMATVGKVHRPTHG